VPSVCDVDPDAPCELDPVFAKALAKDPAARYSSGAEFVAALRASLEQAAGQTRVGAIAPAAAARAPRRRGWLLPLLLAALLAAGIALAVALTRGGSSNAQKPQPVRVTTAVRTVTAQSSTVVRTVVTTAPAPPSTSSAPPPTTAAAGGDPVAENNQAWSMMQNGDYAGALPLLQDAQAQLNGQGSLAEAYTDYNLGYTLTQLGRCSEAMPYLERSWALQPGRKEVREAIKQARKC